MEHENDVKDKITVLVSSLNFKDDEYNVETKKWEVNYMVTNTGQVVGSEKNYRKAVNLYNTILKTSGAGFSIGGIAASEENTIDNVE